MCGLTCSYSKKGSQGSKGLSTDNQYIKEKGLVI
jgi:hypothetical protein